MVSVSESIRYFIRKGMHLHDLKQSCEAGDFFLGILELILIFKDFEPKIFPPP